MLTGAAPVLIIKRRAAAGGLDPKHFADRSLRRPGHR
jgi:hypothetical protein